MTCKKCGAENSDEMKFCMECGEPLPEESETEAAAQEEAPAEEILPEQPEEPVTAETPLPEQSEEPLTEAAPYEAQEELPQETEELSRSDLTFEELTRGYLTSGELTESDDTEEPKSPEVMEALENLKKYEEGTITHPDERPRAKRSFWCPKNPVLWSFTWLLAFGALLGGLTALFFSIDLDGTQIIFGVAFAVFTAAVLFIDFSYYLPAALTLSRLFRGKGVKLEYQLKDHELVEQAEKAKNRNRGFYVAIGLFGLAFSIYYIYILATAIVQTTLMWISLVFSLCVFVIFVLLFFLMPKYNYIRMMQGGKRVIIGEKSVYYGGNYYHWSKIEPEATLANVNSRKHELQLTFLQVWENGKTQRRRVEVYLPDRELTNASNLASAYETSARAYHEKQLKNSVLNESNEKKKK